MYMYTYVYLSLSLYIYIYVYIYICMYTYIYIYIYQCLHGPIEVLSWGGMKVLARGAGEPHRNAQLRSV